jgi:subtilase family serine protease
MSYGGDQSVFLQRHVISSSSNVSQIKPAYILPNASSTPNAATITTLPSIPFNGSQLISLYNIPIVTKTSSRQVKIAIIVAYHHPNLKTDLTMYWQSIVNFGPMSTPPTINVYTFPGATTNNSWNLEECLDTQIIATVNPNASIWIVEAKSERIADINNAVRYATTTLNADVISCSWGDIESSMLNNSNTLFINPANPANNKCFCASSGDNNKVLWPAVLSNVIAVGGTTLLWVPTSSNSINRIETTWSNAGCGYSTSVAIPSYQSSVNKTSKRAIPDISLVANPTNGINIVYNGAWVTIGGTSLACPIFAGVLSLANQQRFNLGKNPLTTVYTQTPSTNAVPSSIPSTNVHQFLYKTIYNNSSLQASCFNDITLGRDGIYSAGVGYDIATGLGSPNVKNLCNAFATL